MIMHWRTARKVVGGNQPSGPHYGAGGTRAVSNSDDRELAALLFASVVFGSPLVFGLAVFLFLVE